MLFLLFQIGQHRYALDSRRVAEVLPLVDIKEIPHAPAGVAGVFNYRGVPVPVDRLEPTDDGSAGAASPEHAHRPGALPR